MNKYLYIFDEIFLIKKFIYQYLNQEYKPFLQKDNFILFLSF